jgi:hypothetical protein
MMVVYFKGHNILCGGTSGEANCYNLLQFGNTFLATLVPNVLQMII